MNPRYKWMPTIQLTDDIQTVHSHAIFGYNWKVVNLKTIQPRPTTDLSCLRPDTTFLLKAAKACGPPQEAAEALKTVTFNHEPLSRFLERQPDIPPVQSLKALLGVEASNQSECMGYTMIVTNPCEESISRKGIGGATWTTHEYIGEETIYFNREHVKGFFKHRGPIVSEITCTFVDKRHGGSDSNDRVLLQVGVGLISQEDQSGIAQRV